MLSSFALAPLRARRSAAFTAVLTTALTTVLVSLGFAASALATPTTYGALARFGGFDSTAYNSGHYGGALTAGKFVDPTGFAVDTNDASAPSNTALYVVDRTSGDQGATTSWRLQKLDDEDKVLGSTTFTLPNEGADRVAIAGLAVDDSGGGGRVYALVEGNDSTFTGLAYAKEILAWSTVPNGSHALVAAASLSADPLGSTGGLLSSEAQLVKSLAKEEALYDPQGIALDVTGGQRDVVVEASDNSGTAFSGIGDIPGVAKVWQVATAAQGGHVTGDLLNSWSAASLSSPASEQQAAPYGISTNPDGSLNVLIASTANGAPIAADVVNVSADLASATLLLDSADAASDPDRSPSYLAVPPGPFSGTYVAQAEWAGPGLVQLSEGRYASDFEIAPGLDNESPSGAEYHWTQASSVTGIAKVGIRILQPTQSGLLSDTQASTILNTLGEGEAGETACRLSAESESLAAGANGTLWVLGRGLDTANWVDSGAHGTGDMIGREIVELGPGAGSACPQPSGPFSASKAQFTAGTTIQFSAETVKLQDGVPFAYEWDLDGNATNGPKHDGFEVVNQLGLWPNGDGIDVVSWPPPTAEFKYTQPGKYTVRLRIVSDYGTYEAPPQTLTVTAPPAPTAEFKSTPETPTEGQQATFDATASTAPAESKLAHYHWSWGDGSSEVDSESATITHTFATAGHYTVTLTVEDSKGRTSEAFSKEVVVAAREVEVKKEPEVKTPGGGGTQTTPPPPSPPADHSPTDVSPKVVAVVGGLQASLECPAAKLSCAGTVQVKTASAVAASPKKAKKAHKVQLVLGSGSFSLAGGASQTLTMHLSAKGMALLAKAKSLRVLVIVSAHDSFGDPKTVTLSLTLKAPVKKRRGKH